jgi:hypothetical protein
MAEVALTVSRPSAASPGARRAHISNLFGAAL